MNSLSNSLTPAQQAAALARGNVLVSAGAGTGKTKTLVERILSVVSDPAAPADLDQILVVTFTEAAAAEMRQRLASRLQSAAAEAVDHATEAIHWERQLALLERARISTIHSFCYELVREHFFQLGVDPHVKVAADEQSIPMRTEAWDRVLNAHLAGTLPPRPG